MTTLQISIKESTLDQVRKAAEQAKRSAEDYVSDLVEQVCADTNPCWGWMASQPEAMDDVVKFASQMREERNLRG